MNARPIADDLARGGDAFSSQIYTPLEDALAELEARQLDAELAGYVARMLPHGVPPPMRRSHRNLVLFRHIATPNFETARFLAVTAALTDFVPLILEYHDDQFNDRNQYKHLLGKLCFEKGINRRGERMFERVSAIHFNTSNTKPFGKIATHWKQPFVLFHHELFERCFPQFADAPRDVSAWLHCYGPAAADYYQPFFASFLAHGILLENFRFDKQERGFTEAIMLPAFSRIEAACGKRPLIVRLLPPAAESDDAWYSYPYAMKQWVEEKRSG
jgi:hypothetical protein